MKLLTWRGETMSWHNSLALKTTSISSRWLRNSVLHKIHIHWAQAVQRTSCGLILVSLHTGCTAESKTILFLLCFFCYFTGDEILCQIFLFPQAISMWENKWAEQSDVGIMLLRIVLFYLSQSYHMLIAQTDAEELPSVTVNPYFSFGAVTKTVSEMKQHLNEFSNEELVKVAKTGNDRYRLVSFSLIPSLKCSFYSMRRST